MDGIRMSYPFTNLDLERAPELFDSRPQLEFTADLIGPLENT